MACQKEHAITTPQGTYVGTVEQSGVISFKGIPYAKPPVGDLRWQPPMPMGNNDMVMPADKFPPAPIQPEMPDALARRLGEPPHTPQSEDCLYLNIWTWDVTTPKKAILFWLYGGSYTIGHASRLQERGENFVAENHDIVVVSCNYRLGVFGSLNLSSFDPEGAYAASCNLNLLDQQAALRWVRENSESFGGDPDRITLYGHSAGSNSISHHLAIPSSTELFQRAICQSSFLVGHGTVSVEESKASAEAVFEAAGVDSLEQAMSLSAERLLAAQVAVFGQAYPPPVLDNVTVFPDELERIANGELSGKQLLVGNSSGEYDQLFVGLDAGAALDKAYQRNSARLGDEGKERLQQYAAMHQEMDAALAYTTANNELGMTLGGEIQARACSANNDVYKFLFSWVDPAVAKRAPHGAPCPFVFGTTVSESAPPSLEWRVQTSWANFIRSGTPGFPGVPEWKKYSPAGGDVMNIDAEWTIEKDSWEEDYEFWRSLFPETEFAG